MSSVGVRALCVVLILSLVASSFSGIVEAGETEPQPGKAEPAITPTIEPPLESTASASSTADVTLEPTATALVTTTVDPTLEATSVTSTVEPTVEPTITATLITTEIPPADSHSGWQLYLPIITQEDVNSPPLVPMSGPQVWTEAPLAISPVLTANSTITILGIDAFQAVHTLGQFWMGGGVFATARELPVYGVMFQWDSQLNGKRMCEDGSTLNANPCAWPNTSENFSMGNYCSALPVANLSGQQVCDVAEAGTTYTFLPPPLGFGFPALTAGLGWEQRGDQGITTFAVRNIRLIYYSVPSSATLLDRMRWSSLSTKNRGNDLREGAVTACICSQGYVGDPINTQTGGFDFTWVDLSIPTVAGALVFQRTYASVVTNTYTTTLGYGWTHNHDTRLIFPTDPGGEPGVVWFKAHSANQYRFTDNGNGTYTPYPGVLAALTYNAISATHVLTNTAQAVYTFDSAGKLLSWKGSQDHTFNYTYSSGRLTRVTESSSGRYVDLRYTDA
ncbi:MAG: DUF6531 domain-containing protein, partial [Nitrososphaera sp.]